MNNNNEVYIIDDVESYYQNLINLFNKNNIDSCIDVEIKVDKYDNKWKNKFIAYYVCNRFNKLHNNQYECYFVESENNVYVVLHKINFPKLKILYKQIKEYVVNKCA